MAGLFRQALYRESLLTLRVLESGSHGLAAVTQRKGPPARVRRRALVKRKPNANGDYTPDVESVQPRKLGCPTPPRAGLNFVRCDKILSTTVPLLMSSSW